MPDLLPPLMFCTDGNVNNAIGTCHGDSGGPLIKKYCFAFASFVLYKIKFEFTFVSRDIDAVNATEKYVLVGIVNGNPRGCRDNRLFPDYHASIGNEEVRTILY